MMVAKVTVLLLTTAMAKHHHSNKKVLDQKNNFFGNVYITTHTIMDNLFESIGLATNFSKESNTKLLLTMHYDLSNIADKNFDTFNDVKNIINVAVSNYTLDNIKLDTVVNEVLNENNYDVYNRLRGTRHKNKHASNKKKDKTKISAFEDSKEFTEFVVKFLAKINNLTIQDFKNSDKYVRNAVPPNKNLKVWDTPPSIELESVNNTNSRRIYKGVKTQISRYPFVVSIHIMGEFACAGCIINRDLVITSASCLQIAYQNNFFYNNLKSIYVRLGSDHTTRGGETIPVQGLYFHPEYEPVHLLNNLALLRLERRIRFSRQQKRIRRILWDKTQENLTNETQGVLILGWGATKKHSVMRKHPKLSVDKLDILNYNDCKNIYSEDFVTKENFCAGFKNKSGGACNGDIGGPGIIGRTLVGVVSFGAPVCGTVDAPTVFTKVGFYAPWIESIVKLCSKENKNFNSNQNTRRGSEDVILRVNETAADNNNNQYANMQFRSDDYPEEVKVLRDILLDLVRTDTAVVDEVIYGDLYDEFSKIFKSKEQSDEKEEESPTNKKKSKRISDKGSSQESINAVVTTASSLKHQFRNVFSESCSSSNDEMNRNNAMKHDYTDNYEGTSDERGLSIEIPKRFFSLEKSDKSKESEIQSSRMSDISSDSNTLNDDINIFARNRDNPSKKSDVSESSSDEMIATHIPFSGTRLDFNYKENKIRDKANERAKHAVMKNDHVFETNSTIFIHFDGKSLAVKPYFIDLGKFKMTRNSQRYTP